LPFIAGSDGAAVGVDGVTVTAGDDGGGVDGVIEGAEAPEGSIVIGVALTLPPAAGAELSGAPTGIAQV
jgi:hypothetical protein